MRTSSLSLALPMLLLGGTISAVPAAEFLKHPAESKVTTMACTDDNKTLILGHQGDDKLTVWDVASAKKVREVACPKPRYILVRGPKVFVANFGKGTISVFNSANWELADELSVGDPNPVYLSAPQGKYFKNVLIACCGDGNGREVKVVDTAKDRSVNLAFRPVKSPYMSVVTVDYTGKTLFAQGTVGHSISAGIEGFADFRAAVSSLQVQLKDRQWASMPIVYQVAEGGYWFGGNQVWRGLPPQLLNDKAEGNIIVPDRTRRACYMLTSKAIQGFALDGKMSSLGEQAATYPAEWGMMKSQSPFPNRGHGNAVYFSQFAATLDGALYLYVLDESDAGLFFCKALPFQAGATLAAGAGDDETAAKAEEPGGADASAFPDKVQVGKKVTYQLPGGAGTTWELTSDQQGAAISNRGELTWTPARADIGPQTLKIKVKTAGKVNFLRLSTEVIGIVPPRSSVAGKRAKAKPEAPPAADEPEMIDSAPLPEQIPAGKPIAHRVFPQRPKGRLELVDAPAGVTLAVDGTLNWTPSDEQVGEHSFKIKVTVGTRPSFVRLQTKVIDRVSAAAEDGDKESLASLGVHPMPGDSLFLAYGLDGQSVLALNGDTLTVLDASGVKRLHQAKTERDYKAIYERPGYYVALAASGLDLLDKKSFKTKKEIALSHSQLVSLAIHPTKPISYVTANDGLDSTIGPMSPEVFQKQPVIEVHETTGKSADLPGVFGKWVATEPTGRHLFTGVWHIYKAGLNFTSPAGVIDEFGNVDVLLAYDLRGARPVKEGENKTPGRNGKGLVVSPDGRFVSYVSAAGMQSLPYAIPAFLATNINSTYSHYKISGFCNDVSYHPALDLVASINENGAAPIVYKLKSGQPVTANYLPAKRQFKGVARVLFSPDGRRLLVGHSHPGLGPVLESVALNLSEEEAKAAGWPASRAAPAADSAPPAEAAAMRTWTSADGNFTIEAQLIAVEGDAVTLKKADGKTIAVPLDRLSPADRVHARQSVPKP